MSKQTVLELVQNILASMDSDEVNSISDTSEARSVAQIIKTSYYNIMARANLPEHKKMFNLISSSEDTQPVLMLRPDDVSRIEWIKYNKEEVEGEDNFQYVTILPIDQYMEMIHQLDVTESNVDTFTLNNVEYAYENDRHPSFCTVVDDFYIIFNSFDNDFDTILQTSNSLAFGQKIPHFEIADAHYPDMDEQQYPLLLNEAKAACFFELKQMPHERAERETRRQWVTLQRTKKLDKQSDFDKLPNFGRR
jgi:hypothetical protein